MSFDALTIGGFLVAVVSGGFLVGVVSHNDKQTDQRARQAHKRRSVFPGHRR